VFSVEDECGNVEAAQRRDEVVVRG
jgi:hypothetical protein